MKLYSTKNPAYQVNLAEAVMQGLPPDNGLYMPQNIPQLSAEFFKELDQLSFPEIGFRVCQALFDDAIPAADLREIINRAITFPAPIVPLDDHRFVLELFHGPSLAFKDFGARFMAQLMAYFNREATQELVILVATSGDTGGAVAFGFHQTPGIRVVILYPSGKVSHLQEKQLTTLGDNVQALEIDGTFDDCQAMVKSAFLDADLQRRLRLSSANSINIARLIPQSFYYFEAYKQVVRQGPGPVVFSIPSGNFGNLTAGLIAQRMGLPVHHFLAATNQNDVVPEYLASGTYQPRPSVPTLSNAMDVGNPSNFARMLDIFQTINPDCSTWNNMQEHLSGYAFTDTETENAMREIATRYQYCMDPHGAVGYLALNAYLEKHPEAKGVILETAHPAKFKPDVERILGQAIEVPERLAVLADRPKSADFLPPNFEQLKDWLLENLG